MILILTTAAGCGHVGANYPRSAPPVTARDRLGDQTVTCEAGKLRFLVGSYIDYPAMRAKSRPIHEQMKAGMGAAAFETMQANTAAAYPWTSHMKNDREHVYYRGSLELLAPVRFSIAKGALVLTMVVETDTLSVPDEGILFHSGSNQRDWRFTGEGVVSSMDVIGPHTLGSDNIITIRLPRAGTILKVEPDTTRLHYH